MFRCDLEAVTVMLLLCTFGLFGQGDKGGKGGGNPNMGGNS